MCQVGEVFGRGIVPSEKGPSGKCPVGEVSVGDVSVGDMSVGDVFRKHNAYYDIDVNKSRYTLLNL